MSSHVWKYKFSTLSGLYAGVALGIGCRNGSTFVEAACDPSASMDLTAARRDSLGPNPYGSGPYAQWARLARTAPGGFAGVYFEPVPRDSKGQAERAPRAVIRLARPNERSAALRVLLPNLASSGLAIDGASVLVVPAKWDFGQLDDWRRYLDARVDAYGVTSAGTNVATNQIRFGVADAASRQTLMRRLRELRVPCGLVAIAVEGIRLIGGRTSSRRRTPRKQRSEDSPARTPTMQDRATVLASRRTTSTPD